MNPLRSVTAKLSLLTCALVLSVIGLMAKQLFNQVEENHLLALQARAEQFARAAREAMVPKPDPFALHFAVTEMKKDPALTYAAVLDESGKALSHTDHSLIGTSPKTAPGGYHLAAPVTVGPRTVGTVRIGFDRSSLDAALKEPKQRILLLAAAATAAAVFGSLLIVGWITRPLPMLAKAAQEVGRGNFSVQVAWKSRDEIGTLARAFNEMTIANELLFKTIKQEKEKLETVFHETREGLVWVSAAGRVLLINPSARALLGAQGAAVDLASLLKPFKCGVAPEKLLEGHSRITPFEFRRDEPKLLILSGVCDRLGQTGPPAGFLLIFHDATLEKRGESLSRNFLSLVSHKLRTPLTVALGFLEMIQQDPGGLNDFQRKALSKIKGEEEKLRSLVEKLIAYSTAVSPESIVLERGDTDLSETVERALKQHSAFLDSRGAKVAKRIPPLRPLVADQFLLREALGALVENAVKFNKNEKPSVSIEVVEEEGHVLVTVKDDGPGIPSEEHPKLFRKFYQIDDDFTGQIPGWGLGLAFVKNVVAAHGGTVGVSSEPGKGSSFWLRLPLRPA